MTPEEIERRLALDAERYESTKKPYVESAGFNPNNAQQPYTEAVEHYEIPDKPEFYLANTDNPHRDNKIILAEQRRMQRPYNYGSYHGMREEVSTEATCLECGILLGEYTDSGTHKLYHPMPDMDSKVLVLYQADIMLGREHMSRLLGKWIREIHALDTKPAPVMEISNPPPAAFTQPLVNRHTLDIFNEVVGSQVREIAAALHLFNMLGPMQEIVLNVDDDCGFAGEIVLRVREMCDESHASASKHAGGRVAADKGATSAEDVRVPGHGDGDGAGEDGEGSDEHNPRHAPHDH